MTNEDIERLKDIFVPRKECQKNIEAEDKKIEVMREENKKTQIAVAKLDTKLGIIISILGAIAVAVLSVCVKSLFGG